MDVQIKSNTLTIAPPKSRGSENFYPESDGEPMAESDFLKAEIERLNELLKEQ